MRPFVALTWLVSAALASPVEFPDLRGVLTSSSHKWSPQTIISFPGSDQFQSSTLRWCLTNAPTFTAAVTPANEDDVAAAVKIARQFDIPFLATGKRHGAVSTLAKFKKGIAIDLSGMNSYKFDYKASTVTIGGGASIGQFQDKLYDAGLMMPGGSCACPGYVGLTVGAGVGRYMGKFGLVNDNLISARVVTAKGEIITVSEKENSDLFWGMRGAGANFGIITSATYKAYKAKDNSGGKVLTADIIFEAKNTARYFKYLESLQGKMPANSAGIHIIGYNNATNDAQLLVNWVWFGPEKEGRKFMNQFMKLGHSTVRNFVYIPWNKLIATSFGGFNPINEDCTDPAYRNIYTINQRRLPAPTYQNTFKQMQKWYKNQPDARSSWINIEVFPNQAVAALGHDATAYPWRDSIAYIQVGISVNDLSDKKTMDEGDRFARKLREGWHKTSGYPEGNVYINYAHGDESLEAIYGRDKLPRLAKLKKQWDPTNVFAYNNALPAKYP